MLTLLSTRVSHTHINSLWCLFGVNVRSCIHDGNILFCWMSAGAFVHKNIDSFNPSTLTENERKHQLPFQGLGSPRKIVITCWNGAHKEVKGQQFHGDLHTATKLHSIPDCKLTKMGWIMDVCIGIQAEILAHTNADAVGTYCIIIIMTKYRTNGFLGFIFTTHYVSSVQSAGCTLAHGYVVSFSSML